MLDVTASSFVNLNEAADSEISRMRAARLAKFAYAGTRSSTPAFRKLRISSSPPAADNLAGAAIEVDEPANCATPSLPDSASTPAPRFPRV